MNAENCLSDMEPDVGDVLQTGQLEASCIRCRYQRLNIAFPSRRIGLPRRKHSREECEFRGNVAGDLRRYLPETLEKLADFWVVLRHLFEVGDCEDNVPT